jgi:hypothetical protein
LELRLLITLAINKAIQGTSNSQSQASGFKQTLAPKLGMFTIRGSTPNKLQASGCPLSYGLDSRTRWSRHKVPIQSILLTHVLTAKYWQPPTISTQCVTPDIPDLRYHD